MLNVSEHGKASRRMILHDLATRTFHKTQSSLPLLAHLERIGIDFPLGQPITVPVAGGTTPTLDGSGTSVEAVREDDFLRAEQSCLNHP